MCAPVYIIVDEDEREWADFVQGDSDTEDGESAIVLSDDESEWEYFHNVVEELIDELRLVPSYRELDDRAQMEAMEIDQDQVVPGNAQLLDGYDDIIVLTDDESDDGVQLEFYEDFDYIDELDR